MVVDYLPKSLCNLRNISNVTKIRLQVRRHNTHMQLTGPNRRLYITSHLDTPYPALESLARFNTSMVVRLVVVGRNRPFRGLPYRELLRLKNLRTLTLSRCRATHIFVAALHPDSSTPKVMACPKLEELIFVPCTDGGGDSVS